MNTRSSLAFRSWYLLMMFPLSLGSESQTTCESPNVRTVLFRQTDLVKECWSEEEMVLLYTRRMMQDAFRVIKYASNEITLNKELIPKKVPCRIPLLLEFMKMSLEAVRDVASSVQAHRLIILAIADALGGYLQAYGIPVTNSKYYEGTVSYCTARQVNELQAAFKKTLDTDGGGWTRAIYVQSSPTIEPFVVPSTPPAEYCSNLITNSDMATAVSCQQEKMNIPLPFLDDLVKPRSVAVPFRDKSLYSLFNRNSSDILLRYYSIALRCLGPPPGMASDIAGSPQTEKFLCAYHSWLCKAVLPHLHDETWYPGFGGVYRILEAMVQKGLSRCEKAEPVDDFSIRIEETCECEGTSSLFYLAAVLALIILFWIIVCLLCCLIKCCASTPERESSCSTSTTSSGAFINTLASLYCDREPENKSCKSSASTPLLNDKP